MKKVLIISYFFPPAGTVGVFRITKFIKYLHEFGWEPIVLTLKQDVLDCPYEDKGFLKDLPADLQVYRTGVNRFVPFNAIEKKWVPNLLKEAKKIYCSVGFDAVLVSGPPFYASLAGFYLKKKYKVPFIFDMRDPWALSSYAKPETIQNHFDRFIVSFIEPKIIFCADVVLCASPFAVKKYSEYYSKYSDVNKKFIYLSNGFDQADYLALKAEEFLKFTIIHSGKGKVISLRKKNFLTAFQKFIQAKNFNKHDIQFIHIGEPELGLMEDVKRMGLCDYFYFAGYLPYKDCINKCIGADLLMIFTDNNIQEAFLRPTTKMYDYTACKRPIMAIGERIGILAQYIEEFNSNNMQLVEDSEDAILNGLEYFYNNRYLNKRAVVYDEQIERKYHRREITKRLSDILNEITR
ncbi:MAG: hypothetical protein HQL12_08820 [Candidatus Omnitrophica bacterium]|nr:hypothetical protein [Candidatus Omnitrophota bacterium]